MQKTRDSARDRLSFMYGVGTVPGEVDRCLSETKKRLVAAGAKADNLPVGIERRVRFLAGLQPKPEAIVRDWFKKNAIFEGLGDAGAALECIHSASASNMDTQDAKIAWRTLLRAHTHREIVPGVEAFLAGADAYPTVPRTDSLDHASPAVIEISDEDADLCIAIAEGKSLPAPSRPLPALISGMLASMRGDERTAAERSAELGANSNPLAQKLGLAISALQSRRSEIPARASARKLQPYVHGMIDSADNVPFIGVVKKVLSTGHIFVSLTALHIDGTWTEVSPMQARALFPSSGDATASPHSIPGTFIEGEIGIWTAELKSPDKSTQYVITQHQGRAYSVNQVPHSSRDPDEVRRWLIDAYKPSPGSVPIFHLSDGVALRLPGDFSDPGKFNFDMPLDCYRGLEPIELGAGRLVLAPHLPAGIGKFHCEPSGTLIKRLFKQAKDSENVPVLGKVQLQALANFANLSSSESDLQAHARALESLGNAADAKAFLDETIRQILELPEIKGRIGEEIAEIAEKYSVEQNTLKNEIADLTEKRRLVDADLEARKEAAQVELERLKKASRQQEAELEKRIKNTFDKAAESGLETLANAALLKAILVGKPAAPPAQETQASPASSPPRKNADFYAAFPTAGNGALPNKRSLMAAVTARAEQSGLSETMILSAIALASVQPVIGLTGQSARKAIAVLAALMADGVMCEVSVNGDMFSVSDLMNAPALVRSGGRGWPATLGAFLEAQDKAGRASIVELRGANRAPPESLLPELAEPQGSDEGGREICWRDAAGGLRHVSLHTPAVFALTFAAGKSVFPVQGALAACMPMLHADGPWGDETEPSGEPAIDPTAVSSEVWNTLSGEAQPGRLKSSTPQALASQAVEALGFSAPKAQAIASLAFLTGRTPSAGLLSEVERLSPDLVRYATAASHGAIARAVGRIFEREFGATDD